MAEHTLLRNSDPAEPPVCDVYSSGEYFADPERHAEDAEFKAEEFAKLLSANPGLGIRSIADVGCGSGAPTIAVVKRMQQAHYHLTYVTGYDVSPHIEAVRHSFIRFVHGDFVESDEFVDLVTLFDVVEHVPDPVTFLKNVGHHALLMCVHLPLDGSFDLGLRDVWRRNLKDPGHLLVLDASAALNLIALAGLRVLDYSYTPSFRSCSGRKTTLAKMVYCFRRIAFLISPWLVAKTLGGVSLMILARTPTHRPATRPNGRA